MRRCMRWTSSGSMTAPVASAAGELVRMGEGGGGAPMRLPIGWPESDGGRPIDPETCLGGAGGGGPPKEPDEPPPPYDGGGGPPPPPPYDGGGGPPPYAGGGGPPPNAWPPKEGAAWGAYAGCGGEP